MKALILAAGYATRLYPLTKDKPKPLLPVGNKPIIEYIIDKINDIAAVDTIYIVTNDKFSQHFAEWSATAQSRAAIEIINDGTKNEDDRLGAIGDINFVIKNKNITDELLIVAGDNLFDCSLVDFVDFAGNNVGIVSYDIGDLDMATKYGVIAIDTNKQIISFEEKPKEPKSTLVSMGIYFFPKAHVSLIDKYLNREEAKSDEPGNYICWLTENNKVLSYVWGGKWYDIGDLKSLEKADKEMTSL